MDLLGTVMSPVNQWLPVLLLVVGTIVIGLVLTVSIRAKIARRNADRPEPHERIESIKATAQASGNVHAATAAFLDTAQRLAAQLDNKAERLEQLLHDADARIAELKRQGEACTSDGPSPVAPGPVADPAGHRHDQLTQAVYELADADRTTIEIARQLDEQVGTVELILALRRRGTEGAA